MNVRNIVPLSPSFVQPNRSPQLEPHHPFAQHSMSYDSQLEAYRPFPQRSLSYDAQPAHWGPPPTVRPVVTTRDIPRLVGELSATGNGINIDAAEHLARMTQTKEDRDHVADAVNANVIHTLVGYLSDPGVLKQHALTILSTVLYFDHTWTPALNTNLLRLLVWILSDTTSLNNRISAACALANITRSDAAKKKAVETGAIPPLVVALGSRSSKLKEMSIRAMRNIVAVDPGRKAAYSANALQRIVPLLDDQSSFHCRNEDQ
jgi:hypothetical protein